MKLTIERAALLKCLGHVQSVVERRNTIPILSNVKIEAGDGKLALNATDMDLDIVEGVAADVAEAGATTAPAHTLYDIVRKLPEGAQVVMEKESGGQLVLKAGRSRFALSCLPTEDFPVLGSGELPHQFKMPVHDLNTLLDRTRFAISTEETRYYLNGIYLHVAERDGTKVLRAVATDGHRLASAEVPLPEGADGFAVDEIVITSKLIDGTFPDYERVIPRDNDKMLDVDRKLLADAVDRVSAISSEKSRAVKLTLGAGVLKLSASSPEHGLAEEEIEVDYNGDGLEIGFNAAYLLDITRQIEGDTASLAMADAASPTVLRETGDESALFVLMPMRV